MLGKPIGIYKFEEKSTDPGTTTKTFEGPEVRKDTIVILHHGSVVDYTTADKALLIGKKDGGGNVHYLTKRDASTRFEAHMNGWMVLLPTEKPIGVVESPTANDVLYCSFYGFVYELP